MRSKNRIKQGARLFTGRDRFFNRALRDLHSLASSMRAKEAEEIESEIHYVRSVLLTSPILVLCEKSAWFVSAEHATAEPEKVTCSACRKKMYDAGTLK